MIIFYIRLVKPNILYYLFYLVFENTINYIFNIVLLPIITMQSMLLFKRNISNVYPIHF